MLQYEKVLECTISAIFGHAIGDALGVPVEFATREELKKTPITTMHGFGSFAVPAGSWSDDTSMTLATLDLLSWTQDPCRIMDAFCNWLDKADYTPTGICFDIGYGTEAALEDYKKHRGRNPFCGGTDEMSNGNGSLMRIIPAALYSVWTMDNVSERLNYIHCISSLTHAHWRSMIGCGIYACILWQLLENRKKDEAIKKGLMLAKSCYGAFEEFSHYDRIYKSDFASLHESQIKSSGYIVHTLEAALWCLLNSNSYSECVLKAVNLGSDTDTVAAVSGGLAGCLYGSDSFPMQWVAELKRSDYILGLCRRFAKALTKK